MKFLNREISEEKFPQILFRFRFGDSGSGIGWTQGIISKKILHFSAKNRFLCVMWVEEAGIERASKEKTGKQRTRKKEHSRSLHSQGSRANNANWWAFRDPTVARLLVDPIKIVEFANKGEEVPTEKWQGGQEAARTSSTQGAKRQWRRRRLRVRNDGAGRIRHRKHISQPQVYKLSTAEIHHGVNGKTHTCEEGEEEAIIERGCLVEN